MYKDFLIVGCAVCVILYATIKCHRRCKRILKRLEIFSKYCTNKQPLYTNIFQSVHSYESEYFSSLVVVCTFKKLFDPTQWFFLTEDKLIMTGNLDKRINTFISKKSLTISHLATTFLSKHIDDKYKVYGNKQFLPLVKKYNIDKLYITYLPQSHVRDCSFKTVFYMEMRLSRVNEQLLDELFAMLAEIEDCGDERYKELKKKYETNLGNEIMKLNIKERSEKVIEERQSSGVEYKRKKDKKTQKSIIKRK